MRGSLILLLGIAIAATAQAQDQAQIERGEYLLYAGGCLSCHRAEDGTLAGGQPLETPVGIFYPPNITPDPQTGIGDWSDEDFIHAFRQGESPGGYPYYPAFPYTSYHGMSDQDLLDLKAYLFSLEPVKAPPFKGHDLPWYVLRFGVNFWQMLNHQPQPFQPDPSQSEQWNRGAYLVRHLGHCGECHTPRTMTFAMDQERFLAGNPHGPEGGAVPNITSHYPDGLYNWDRDDLTYLLETGMLPDGDFVGGTMSEVVDDNTSRLTPEDREAIAVYILSQPSRSAAE
ncbi:MAG: cytochrome c [Candidatus Competibacteraceae bacterium]|nr:cytochrome c [Candidatus Competibacteraceae bacterium]